MEMIRAPFWHTPDELKQAIRETSASWLEATYPDPLVIRLFEGDPTRVPVFVVTSKAFGAGHLWAQDWVDMGWGICIKSPQARETLETIRAARAVPPPNPRCCFGYVVVKPSDATMVLGDCAYLDPISEEFLGGASEAFLPVEVVRVDIDSEIKTRLRPFLPASP